MPMAAVSMANLDIFDITTEGQKRKNQGQRRKKREKKAGQGKKVKREIAISFVFEKTCVRICQICYKIISGYY